MSEAFSVQLAHGSAEEVSIAVFLGFSAQHSPNGGDKEEDGAKPLRQPREGRQPKPIRQAESEIPVFALFANLANMDPRTKSELITKKRARFGAERYGLWLSSLTIVSMDFHENLWF